MRAFDDCGEAVLLKESVKRVSSAMLSPILAVAVISCVSAQSGSARAAPARAQTFLIAPYLYTVGSGVIHLAWQYDSSANVSDAGTVQLSLPTGTKRLNARSDKGLWIADLPIPACGFQDLSYQVSGMNEPVTITPIACAGSSATEQFAVIADAQENPEYVRQLAAQIAQHPGAALLSDGDLVQTGSSLQDWVGYFAATAEVGRQRVLLPAVGNHEYRDDATAQAWSHFFQLPAADAHYSFDLGDAHVIVLNSCFNDDPGLIDAQIPWLARELAQPARWKLVMFHHPPYSSGVANSPFSPKKEYLDLQRKYVPLFEKYGVDVVLLGHTHVFERSVKSGVQYLVSGAAGGKMGLYGTINRYSVTKARVRTATYFTVTADRLEAQTLDINGAQVDQLLLSKAARP